MRSLKKNSVQTLTLNFKSLETVVYDMKSSVTSLCFMQVCNTIFIGVVVSESVLAMS